MTFTVDSSMSVVSDPVYVAFCVVQLKFTVTGSIAVVSDAVYVAFCIVQMNFTFSQFKDRSFILEKLSTFLSRQNVPRR